MNAQQIDSVVDALSRTITELRLAKGKLASAEAVNASNLEIKRNLAQRINELQKELAAVQEASAKELQEAKQAHLRDREGFERHLSSLMNYNSGFNPRINYVRPIFVETVPFDSDPFVANRWRVVIPAMHLEFCIHDREFRKQRDCIPFLCDMAARDAGHKIGEKVREDVLKMLLEIK